MDVQVLIEQLRFYSALGVTHLNLSPAEDDAPESPPAAVSLEDIQKQIEGCTRCRLAETRTNLVFGAGNPRADLMFVGEAPGADEDLQGFPFVGAAGQLLSRIIEAIELEREQVYIANVLKCRPPENRNPEPEEIEACEGVLFAQIEAVAPMIVVALGRYAAQTLLRSEKGITSLRGKFYDYHGRLLIPTFHPSYLLHHPSAKRQVWEDMKAVRAKLKELGSRYYQ